MILRGLAAWLLAMVLLTSAAYAHGGVGMVDNRCVLRIGKDIMFFTGYQPQNSREEFCDDVPNAGQTVVALDMQETELRDMLTEIRLIKDDGSHTQMNGLPVLTDADLADKAALDAVSIAYFPPKKYPTGTLTFEHTFPENGKFIGIVTVENDHGQKFVSQFPFAVGQPVGKNLVLYGLILGVLIVGVWAYLALWRKTEKARSSQKPGLRGLDAFRVTAWPDIYDTAHKRRSGQLFPSAPGRILRGLKKIPGPDHRPPHMGDRGIVEAKALLGMAEMAAHNIREGFQLGRGAWDRRHRDR